MITLITGVPGSGKTLSVVSDLAKKLDSEYAGRKIFTHDIPDLAIETTPIPDGYTIHDMHIWLSQPENHGSIVVIDEAQNVFPPRSSSSKAPPIVEWMHVHRHSGADIFLITQMPQRIDKQIRDLVRAHYHININRLGTRMKYFWDYCANNPRTEMKNGQPSFYKLDKSAFGLYKSAAVHTNIKTPKSKVIWVLPISLICFLFFAAFSFFKISDLGSSSPPESAKVSTVAAADQVAAGISRDLVQGSVQPLTEAMFVPSVEGRVETKPIYDNVRQVKSFEYPVACIKSGKSCNCYTDQATKILEIGHSQCLDYVSDGLPFNPYKEPPQISQHVEPSQSPSEGSQVLALTGHNALTIGAPTPFQSAQ